MIEERIKLTRQGYKYIEVTPEEVYKWGGMCVCDTCGEEKDENMFLIWVLGRCICKTCFEEWEASAGTYAEDLALQEEQSDAWFKYHLDR